MAIDVEKLIRDVRSANSAQTSARDDSGHVAVVQGKGSANSAQTSARDDNDPWYLKAAKWIDEHTTNDADVTFNYADAMAKKAVNSGVKTPSWVEGAKASGNAAQYIVDKSLMQTVDSDGNGSYSGAEKVRGLISGGYSGGELVAKVREYMTTESGNCELGDVSTS